MDTRAMIHGDQQLAVYYREHGKTPLCSLKCLSFVDMLSTEASLGAMLTSMYGLQGTAT